MAKQCGIVQYYFEVPIRQHELYMKHIIEGIYGIKESACRITQTRNGVRTIHIGADPNVPLINSLPMTIVQDSPLVHHENTELVTAVGEKINTTFMDFRHHIGTYYTKIDKIMLSPTELKSVIMQLARERKINKFIELKGDRFLVHIEGFLATAIVKVVDNILVITIYARIDSMFDVDDGYTGILTELNSVWSKWKEAGDITTPIHPPNIV